jgi:hypothetical protein
MRIFSHPGCGFFPIPDADFFPSRIRIFSIPDPGFKKAPDPGSGSAHCQIACYFLPYVAI